MDHSSLALSSPSAEGALTCRPGHGCNPEPLRVRFLYLPFGWQFVDEAEMMQALMDDHEVESRLTNRVEWVMGK